jgi:hypothetical protein
VTDIIAGFFSLNALFSPESHYFINASHHLTLTLKRVIGFTSRHITDSVFGNGSHWSTFVQSQNKEVSIYYCLCGIYEKETSLNRLVGVTSGFNLSYSFLSSRIRQFYICNSLTRSRVSQYSIWLRTGQPGFEPRQGQKIFLLACASRPALGPTQSLVQWVPGVLSPGVKRGRGVILTTHPYLVPRLRMTRSYTSSPPKRLHGV